MPDYSLNSDFVKGLDREILNFIEKGLENRDEETFNRLALREFELQFHTVKPYRDFCLRKGITPETISHWEEIPAVPTMAFKKFVLATFPLEQAVQMNLSSGTTAINRSKVYRDRRAVEIMVRANALLTREYLFPDRERMKILFFAPSPKLVPTMGMAIGLGEVKRLFGTKESRFLITYRGLDIETLLRALYQAEDTGEPIALVGATSAFIYFFNACEKEGLKFRLPPGSRICDGGGYQGQFGECTREEFWEKCYRILGIPAHYCINVLGMAEISTNFFDNVLKSYLKGIKKIRYKELPPWTRIKIVDPETLKPVPPGEVGLLCHYDLANRAMMFAVQTDNVGVAVEDGFEILGRWRKKDGQVFIDRTFQHPGGRLIGAISEFLLRRRFSRLGKICVKIKKGGRDEKRI